MGERIEIATAAGNGGGYLAVPAKPGPGLVVIQEWWGVNAHIEDLCDRFAVAGYLALAPDLYHGRVATTVDDAQQYMTELDPAIVGGDLGGAVSALRAHPQLAPDRVGVIGYCLGGALSISLAASGAVDAAVAFYGLPPDPDFDPASVKVPVQGHFGGRDEFARAADAKALFEQISGAGGSAELHVYDGSDHAFFNDTRPEVYDAASASKAWDRTLVFLGSHLS